MDLQVQGKRALITGSSAGIGYAIAERLALEGASVIVNGRTQRRVDQALAALARSGARGSAEGLSWPTSALLKASAKPLSSFPMSISW